MTEADDPSTPEAELWRARIRTSKGRVVLPPGEYLVGRSPSCHVVVNAPNASRRHAKLVLGPAGCFVQDLGSANGVFVEGQKIGVGALHPVADGAQVLIGSEELALSFGVPSQTGVPRPTMRDSEVAPAAVPLTTGPDADGPTAATERASALELLGGVAERAISTGHADRAEGILTERLREVLHGASAGRSVSPRVRDEALRRALQLAQALRKAEWFEFAVQLLASLRWPAPEPLLAELRSTLVQLTAVDVGPLEQYLKVLRELEPSMEKVKATTEVEKLIEAAKRKGPRARG